MGLADFLDVLLEILEPFRHQVTILEHEPHAPGHGLVEKLDGDLFLALAHSEQLDPVDAELGAFGELEQIGGWIGAW